MAEESGGALNGAIPASRLRAPIAYSDVARSYNTVRALSSILIAGVGAWSWLHDVAFAEFVIACGVIAAVHAVLQRRHPTTALSPLLIDSTVLGVLSVVQGFAGAVQGAGFVYILTGALLLLPLRPALSVIAYGAAWSIPLVVFDGLNPGEPSRAVEIAAIAAAAAIVAQLLYATGGALFAAEARHREALAAERRALELKDEFVSMVSHELRTPLTSIGGFADTLRENWASLPSNEVDEFLVIMRGEANHLSNLVEDILVIPRLEAGRLKLEPEPIGLRRQAFEIGRLVFGGSSRELQVDIPADVFVMADPNRLRQIFRNLLENARKYGGDQVLVAGERMNDVFKVVVADNGPGIPVGDRDRIFEHFEQAVKGDARSEGVGLGLPIARKLARAMGGDLWFEPRFPTGAQFLFTVAIAPPGSSGTKTEPPVADNITPIFRTG